MIIDKIRDKKEFSELYNSIDNSNLWKLEELLDYPNIFCFYSEITGKLVGCIYLERKKDKNFLSGFSKRKNLHNNIEAVNAVCDYFDFDMYSTTPYKHAGYVLKKTGFKKIDDNLYIRSKNGR